MSTSETTDGSCARPTSTADETSRSSVVSRKRAYTPGGPVDGRKRLKRKAEASQFPQIPFDVLDKILTCILDTQVGLLFSALTAALDSRILMSFWTRRQVASP